MPQDHNNNLQNNHMEFQSNLVERHHDSIAVLEHNHSQNHNLQHIFQVQSLDSSQTILVQIDLEKGVLMD